MKIALIFFQINNVGGITTWNRNIMTGLRRIGYNPEFIYCTQQNSMTVSDTEEIDKKSESLLPGRVLSFNDKNILETIKDLNRYDLLIFTKISPHPTKANLACKDIENWKLLYTETKAKKVVVFHDNNWEKTNPWAIDVAPYVDICVAAQKKFMHAANAFLTKKCIKYWDYFPVDFEPIHKLDLNDKEEMGICATQWLGWKNHEKFIPHLPDIKVPFILFGSGIEYYYIKKEEYYNKAINYDLYMDQTYNAESIHNNYGFVPYKELMAFYAKSFLCIDLSTRGYTNYTHFEPLCFNSLSLIEKQVAADPDNIIPEDCFISYDLANVTEDINALKGKLNDPKIKQIRKNGLEFVKQMDCSLVAKNLMNKVKQL